MLEGGAILDIARKQAHFVQVVGFFALGVGLRIINAQLCACYASFGKVNNIHARLVYSRSNFGCGSFGRPAFLISEFFADNEQMDVSERGTPADDGGQVADAAFVSAVHAFP